MQVNCSNCRANFEVPLAVAGNIQYAQCKNIFRVTYRFRTPCPHCHHILQLTPHGKDLAVGIPIEHADDESTERTGGEAPLDATLSKDMFATPTEEPLPTVRVTKKALLRSAEPKFHLQERQRIRPTPIHVALRPGRGGKIPFVKISLGLVVVACTAVTVALTLLALRSPLPTSKHDSSPPSVGAPKQNMRAAEPTKLPAGVIPDQGGPEEPFPLQDDIATGDESPISPVARMRLPRVDRLTSGFGARPDPIHHDKTFHGGIDIAGENRSEVKAALEGKVEFAGELKGYGITVILSHTDGLETVYAHLSKPLVRKGRKVRQGELIGLVGTTGRSTGYHVHFELRKNGKKVDPIQAKLLAKLP